MVGGEGLNFWGFTGTNGKTTCTWIAAAFINACPGRKCGYITTVECNDGARSFHTGYTTPPLARLKEIFAAMELNGCTDCVMEVSSHAIHQRRTGETVFSGGAFTNLSEDHLDYHKTLAEYFRVKLSFAERMPPLAPYAVCTDGSGGGEMLEACRAIAGLNVIAVSAADPAFDLSDLNLVGAYNRSNVLTAAALACAAGVPRATVQAEIPKLTPRWGRLEKIENPRVAADVYVDFAHTPDGLEKVLGAARGFTRGKLGVVFGAGGDRDPMKRPLMGAACARHADRLVVTSDNPRGEDPLRIIGQITEGVASVLGGVPAGVCTVEPDRAKAIEYALRNSAALDTVIVAGKGHETEQEICGVRHPFDDREKIAGFA